MDENIAIVSVKRNQEGVKLYAKSQVFEDFFRGLTDPAQAGVLTHPRWKGVEMFHLPAQVIMDHIQLADGNIHAPGERLLLPDGKANLTFLRHKSIGQGVTFQVGTTPVRESYVDKYQSQVKKAMQELYRGYLAPLDITGEYWIERRRAA